MFCMRMCMRHVCVETWSRGAVCYCYYTMAFARVSGPFAALGLAPLRLLTLKLIVDRSNLPDNAHPRTFTNDVII